MFSYVFMKILEMRPKSYDRRMEKVSRGRIREIKNAVARKVPPGSRVLEIGCGTGELAKMMIEHGATVIGFDENPSMITAAQKRIEVEKLGDKFTLLRMGVEGMDALEDHAFDAVVSTLVFSELTPDERRYALKHALRSLKPGGSIIIGDEVMPHSKIRRLLYTIVRAPIVAITYIISRSSTSPIDDLSGEITDAGFTVREETRSHGDTFSLVVALRPSEEARS